MNPQLTLVRHRLTRRDRAALELTTALRAVRLDDVGVLLAALAGRQRPLGARTTRDVVARWRAMGLVRLEPYPGPGPAMVLPLRTATNLCRLPPPRPLSWVETPHTLATSAVAARYLAKAGGTWVAESRLRMRATQGEHLPDGLWQPTSAGVPTVAVEVERSGKAGARWEHIAYDLLSRHQTVHYWLRPRRRRLGFGGRRSVFIAEDRARIITYELKPSGWTDDPSRCDPLDRRMGDEVVRSDRPLGARRDLRSAGLRMVGRSRLADIQRLRSASPVKRICVLGATATSVAAVSVVYDELVALLSPPRWPGTPLALLGWWTALVPSAVIVARLRARGQGNALAAGRVDPTSSRRHPFGGVGGRSRDLRPPRRRVLARPARVLRPFPVSDTVLGVATSTTPARPVSGPGRVGAHARPSRLGIWARVLEDV